MTKRDEVSVVAKAQQKETFEEVLESQKPNNLAYSISMVMSEVKGIDKAMTVGKGNNSYRGVADKDVKLIIGASMVKYGLVCVPIDIKPTVKVERWSEETQYGNKQKQSVFTEVLATYRITHIETNESIDIMGYGHGVDSMDKSAGKATTYALKNALLYTFLVPTGAIDDTDTTHSASHSVPQKQLLNKERFEGALVSIKSGDYTVSKLKNDWDLNKEQLETLNNL